MNMTLSELMPLAPVLIVCLTTVLVMLVVSIKRNHATAATTAVVGLNIALLVAVLQFIGLTTEVQNPQLLSILSVIGTQPAFVSPLFVVDAYALFYMILILVGSLACCTLAHAYIDGYKNNREELYLMLLMAVIGALLMVCSQNLTSFFLSLELLSVPTYGLLAYTHERSKSLESGLKYLVLSATASAAMLMGMAFLYAFSGSMQFQDIGMAVIQGLDNPLMMLGMALVLFALAFKLSLFPFHSWTADVYQGAPAPIATFLATVSKIAVLALAIRFIFLSGSLALDSMHTILTVIAVLSIVIGNLLAVRQVNLKRLLAFSSIAHLGYLLVAILCLGIASLPTVGVYLIAYLLTTIGAIPWRHDELAVFCAPSHQLAQLQRSLTAADFIQVDWILREEGSGTREVFDKVVVHDLPNAKIRLTLGHNEAILKIVAGGIGVGCISRLAIEPMLENQQLVILDTPFWSLVRPFFLIVHRQKYQGPGLKSFIEFCQQQQLPPSPDILVGRY